MLICLWHISQNIAYCQLLKQNLTRHIEVLASDSLQGRQAGTPYGLIAAQYVRDEFAKSGLKLLANNGFQFFQISKTNSNRQAHTHLLINNRKFVYNVDYISHNFFETDSICSQVVFVGYGLNSDYQNIDTQNKWIALFSEKHPTDTSNLNYRILTAKKHNAAGVLLITDETSTNYKPSLNISYDFELPVVELFLNASNYLLQSVGNVLQLKHQILTDSNNVQREISVVVCSKNGNPIIMAQTQNVIAMIEGSDPKLANEFVVIGAHYDHLGLGGRFSGSRLEDTLAIHNGADDNASGVSVLIEVARLMKQHEHELKRSVVFVSFGAEEIGLIGSKEFVKSGIIPIDKIKAMLNIDMVGRLTYNSLYICGTETVPETKDIIIELNKQSNFDLKLTREGNNKSDHESFSDKHIPTLFVHTGLHNDYHTPFDDVELINYDGLNRICQYIYDLSCHLSKMDKPLTYKISNNEMMRNIIHSRVQLGFIHNMDSNEPCGYKPNGVQPNKPASIAGIIDGDIIISINGKAVNSLDEYLECTNALDPNKSIDIEIIRDNEVLKFTINL